MVDVKYLKSIIEEIENKNYLMSNIKKKDLSLYNKLMSLYNNETRKYKNLNEFLYCLVNNLPDGGKCKSCNKETKFDRWSTGYRAYCSASCSNKYKEKIEKTKLNNKEKYGVESTLAIEEIKKKSLKSNSYTKEQYIEKLNAKYSENEYIILGEYKVGSNIKLKFKHNICGKEFEKRKDLLLNQHGCPYCGLKNRSNPNRITNEEFIERCIKNNNGQFTPLEEFKTVEDPILLHCNKCGKDFIRV